MKTVCAVDMCTGCTACVEKCVNSAIRIVAGVESYNAVIDENKCIKCNLCHRVCHINIPPELQKSSSWWQGWSKNSKIVERASSGGVAEAIEQGFIKWGGIVCSCTFENGDFTFMFVDKESDTYKFSGSKYVKSNTNGIYGKIKAHLKKGQKVLFVGLPCQVASVKKYVGNELCEKLYTIDLICHGTPSVEVLKYFLRQYSIELTSLEKIEFRHKSSFQIEGDRKTIGTIGTMDCYTIAFLNGISYTECCYNCTYAKEERVSDITLGDSWGSDIVNPKGVSLVLSQSPKGKELINISELNLFPVDIENAIKNNRQLIHPSPKPVARARFIAGVKRGQFNVTIITIYWKQWLKQRIKGILIQLKLYRGGVYNPQIIYKIFLRNKE